MSNCYGLPPCPGCGKDTCLSVWPLDEDLKPDSIQRVDCDCCGYSARREYWGLRPIEDGLRAQLEFAKNDLATRLTELAAAQAEVERLRGIIHNTEWYQFGFCPVCRAFRDDEFHDIDCPFYQWEGGAQ